MNNPIDSVDIEAIRADARRATELAEQSRDTANESITSLEDVVAQVTRLETVSSRINECIEQIAHLTFQTHILSLNAAIEAAQAGELGKGFAIVATEMRQIADTIKQTTQEVNANLDSSNEQIGKVTEAAKHTAELLRSIEDSTLEVASLTGRLV
ncbi:MAG TPA: hypothetical protein ENJ21_02535 [Chromatiaceae bacterium]|nr:hypothetical protein [Chromatiaceae bacterium]